jgi:hypothetical protein
MLEIAIIERAPESGRALDGARRLPVPVAARPLERPWPDA